MSAHPCRTGLTALAVATLAACGGSDKPAPPPAPEPAAARIVGTAAIGAPLVGAAVAITDSAGSPACVGPEVTTFADGSFGCTLADGAAAPFLVLVTDPSGGSLPMVSVGVVTPGVDETATINITPLTTAIVGQLAPDDSALSVLADPSLLDTDALAMVRDKVLAQIAPVLAALDLPADFDPFTTPLVAATPETEGDAGDRLIETLRISRVAGQTLIATVDRPDAAVPLADAATESPAALPAPSAAGDDLAAGMRRLATALNTCFALPVAERVLAQDTDTPLVDGGPEVTDAPAACDGIVDDERYLGNGYRAGQAFHALLTDDAMVGAVFSVPEVMLLLPDAGPDGAHRAVVNLRYVDANGVAGSKVDVAQRLTQAADGVGAAGDWVLVGNQQAVHSSISAVLVRREQLAPGGGSGSGPFGNAVNSRYETSLNVYVNKDGPGSAGLRAVRATGPGLPPAGLVMTRPDPSICSAQDWMNVRRKDGLTDPEFATPAGNTGNRFALQRTQGLAGADAATRRNNPNENNANNTQFMNWAHPLDYGRAPGSRDYIDFSQLRAMTVYTFEFFYDGETAPRHRYDKTLLTPVVPATAGLVERWQVPDAATRRLLDPADALAAATLSMDLSWTPDPLAAPVASIGVYSGGPGGAVNQGRVAVARGATSAVAEAPTDDACAAGTEFPQLTDDGSSWRNLQLRHRRLDGSQQDSFTQFN
jgi:hypothetical protein